MTCCNRSGNIWTTVTGLPDVKLTPYMGAVVLNVDLHSLDGVDSPDSQVPDVVTGFVLSLILALFELVWLLLSLVDIESMFFESDELEVAKLASIAVLDAVDKNEIM